MPDRGGWRAHSEPVRCAAEQLKSGALLVNPYDVEQMADTILQAFRMNQAARSARMKRMRRIVRNENVFWSVDFFFKAGAKRGPSSRALGKRRGSTAPQNASGLKE